MAGDGRLCAAAGRGFESSGDAAPRTSGAAAGPVLRLLPAYRGKRASAGKPPDTPAPVHNPGDACGRGLSLPGDRAGSLEGHQAAPYLIWVSNGFPAKCASRLSSTSWLMARRVSNVPLPRWGVSTTLSMP